MRIWRHPPSLWHQRSKIRPSAWSVKTSSLSFAALWSTSTIGRKGRSENRTYLLLLQFILPCYSFTFCVFFPTSDVTLCRVLSWQDSVDEEEDSSEGTSSQQEVSVLHHVSCRFRWWITGSQKAVGVFQRCCNFLQRRLCWPAVFVCVLSAPKGQGSLLPSNRRRTDKQQRFVSVDTVFTDFYIYCDNLLFYICFFPLRPPSQGVTARWKWIPPITRPDPPPR